MSESIRIEQVEIETRHWIGGEPCAGSGSFEVFSPIDGAVLGEVSAGGSSDVDRAVEAARNAFPNWAGMGPTTRGDILDRFAEAILAHREVLAAVETVDTGSLLVGNLK